MSVNIQAVKNAQAQGLVVGLTTSNGATPLRLEIDEFIQDVDMTNLFLLAMVELMKPEVYQDPFSWFQMGGIHGRPHQPWDGVKATADSDAGYCSHTSILFPTWHRPYIAMVEQAVFLKMADIAEQFPPGAERTKYEQATQRFRHPYWDPVMPRLVETDNGENSYTFGPPLICMFPQVQVKKPEAPQTLVPMPNPLYTFKFSPQAAKFDTNPPMAWEATFSAANQPHSIAANTIRGIDNTGQSDHIFVQQTLGSSIKSGDIDQPLTGGKIYNLLMNRNVTTGQAMGYGEFSNDGYWAAQGQTDSQGNLVFNQNSLEGFHDDIHGNTGIGPGFTGQQNFGMGHMGLIEVAAMDPIFWLHHTNVDRILAIWQTLHPTLWFNQQAALSATFVTDEGAEQTPLTSLFPFRKAGTRSNPQWWTSNDVKHCKALGYDYAIKDGSQNNMPLATAKASDINAWINRSYQWSSLGTEAPIPDNLGYPQNLAAASNLPSVWKIDGKGAEIPHDKGPTPRLTFVAKRKTAVNVVSSAVGETAEAIINAPQAVLSSHQDDWQKKQFTVLADHGADWKKDQFGHLGDLVKDGKMTQWSVSVVVEKFALGGSFTIFFFLGDFPVHPVEWPHAPTLAGLDGVLVNTSVANCPNCKKQSDNHLLVSDHIGLTPSLVQYWRFGKKERDIGITDFESGSVIPFLTRNLHWRVATAAGVEVPRENVAGLKVQVNSQIVHLPQRPEDTPLYEPLKPWPEVTDGRPTGITHDPQDRV